MFKIIRNSISKIFGRNHRQNNAANRVQGNKPTAQVKQKGTSSLPPSYLDSGSMFK